MEAPAQKTVGSPTPSSNSGNCWLLYAKPEHASAKWLEEISVDSYAFWLHGTDAHTRTIKPGDTAIIYIASDDKNGGHIHCVGVIPFIRAPFIFDRERERQRIAVMITHDFRDNPIEWQALVNKANEQLDAAEAYSGNLNPVNTSGAVHSVAPPIQRALADYMSTTVPLLGYADRFNPEMLWRAIFNYGDRFAVLPDYVTSAARRKGEVENLTPISDYEEFASIVIGALKQWPKVSANVDVDPANAAISQKYASPLDDKESGVDHLDRTHIVNSIQATILRDRDSNYKKLQKSATNHLIIGLFGDWGSGKSTVVNLLEQRLTKGSLIEVIKFNAWRESHSQHMSASLVQFILNSLFANLGFLSRSKLTVMTWFKLSRQKLGADFLFTLLFVILCAVLAVFSGKVPDGLIKDWALPASLVGIVASLIFYGKKLLGSNYLISSLRQATTQPNFDKHIGIGYAMRKSLSAVLSLYGGSNDRPLTSHKNTPQKYVIVIDDLDRCSDRVIVQTLEAAQLIVDIEGVTVIFAVDFKILIRAVANKYLHQLETLSSQEAFELARNYLGKLIQISISLPDPSEEALANFVRTRIYELSDDAPTQTPVADAPEPNKDVNDDEKVDRISIKPATTNRQSADQGRDIGSDDFLATNAFEYQQFVDCANAFSITNPRSLVRLYNVIAFAKSSEPLLMNDEEALKQMLFIAFYWEQLTAQSASIPQAKTLFSDAVSFIDHAKQHSLSKQYDFTDADEGSIELLLKALLTYAMPVYDLPEPKK